MTYNSLEGPRPELVVDLASQTDELVSIVIVHRNRGAFLNICLQSIAAMSINNNYEIIVVDNASTDKDVIDYLDGLTAQKGTEIKVIRNEKNLWWAAAANQGAKAADKSSKYLIFMHADVVVLTPVWIDLLINVSEAREAGLVGVDTGTYELNRQRVDFVREWLFLTSRECWKDCGPFMADELPQVGAAFMFTYKAARMNYKPNLLNTVQVAHHFHSYSVDVCDLEKFNEQAPPIIARLVLDMQQKSNLGKPVEAS
jgi:glycosyltransferase involved in cell wall biosynthesis